jgi:hypothetical protein
VTAKTPNTGKWSFSDQAGNEEADSLATTACEHNKRACFHDFDAHAAYVRQIDEVTRIQLTNVQIINARWEMLRALNRVPQLRDKFGRAGDIHETNEEEVKVPRHGTDDEVKEDAVETQVLDRGERPPSSVIKAVQGEVRGYPWKQNFLVQRHAFGEVVVVPKYLSTWHFTPANLQAAVKYFNGLEWSVSEMPVSTLELFFDYIAFTGSMPYNPKARNEARTHAGRLASIAKDYVSMLGAMMRALPKQLSDGQLAYPAKPCLTSGLTSFALRNQAVGWSHRPKFRCPLQVFEALVWCKQCTPLLELWSWPPPWHILLPENRVGDVEVGGHHL